MNIEKIKAFNDEISELCKRFCDENAIGMNHYLFCHWIDLADMPEGSRLNTTDSKKQYLSNNETSGLFLFSKDIEVEK